GPLGPRSRTDLLWPELPEARLEPSTEVCVTSRQRIHRAIVAAGSPGYNRPFCLAGATEDDSRHSAVCDSLVEEFEPADPAMPPPDVIEAMAKGCSSCGECGEAPRCATCMAGGVCLAECQCHETDDEESRYEPEGKEAGL